jgi:hypothetical protein
VFSNGILLLAVVAAILILVVDANLETLLHLYITGVFTSFTLSQAGMVRHWSLALAADNVAGRGRLHRARVVNLAGAVLCAVVLVVVFATKVLEGAWVAVLAMGLLIGMMRRINRYYARFTAELTLDPDQQPTVPTTLHTLVLVVQVNWPVLRAVALARAMRPATLEAVTAAEDARAAEALRSDWARVGCRCRCASSTPPTKTSARPCSTTSTPSRSATPTRSSPCPSPSTWSPGGGRNCCTTKAPYG